MPDVHCFTSFSFSYLSRARVLARTVRKFHPDWVLWACVSDRPPKDLKWSGEGEFDHVIWVEDLPLAGVKGWIFQHTLVELCTAVKGLVLEKILEHGAAKAIYIDPDIALFADLGEVVELLDTHPIVLTPHQVDPESERYAVADNEIAALKHGIYNLGFLGVRNSEEGRRFARWWRDRLVQFCFDDIPNGIFTDQRWCDLVPAFFDGIAIVRDPGYNVASWNLSRRHIRIHDGSGDISVNGRPLRFYHFTKFDHVGEHMIERYSRDNPHVFELVEWYQRALRRLELPGLPDKWWQFATFEDGKPIPSEARRAYRAQPDLSTAFPDPFRSGAGSFQEWWQRQQSA
jgi:hypothetical protein